MDGNHEARRTKPSPVGYQHFKDMETVIYSDSHAITDEAREDLRFHEGFRDFMRATTIERIDRAVLASDEKVEVTTYEYRVPGLWQHLKVKLTARSRIAFRLLGPPRLERRVRTIVLDARIVFPDYRLGRQAFTQRRQSVMVAR